MEPEVESRYRTAGLGEVGDAGLGVMAMEIEPDFVVTERRS